MRKNQNNPPFGADGSALFHNPQANACIFLKLHARDAARARLFGARKTDAPGRRFDDHGFYFVGSIGVDRKHKK